MPFDGASLVKQYDRAKADRANFDEKNDRMAPYIAPSRLGITGQVAPGDKQTRGVYDSTGIFAGELCAQFIAGHIINPSQRWLSYLPFNNNYPIGDEEIEYAEECRDRALRRYSSSMFYAEGPESLVDFVGFGTGCLFIEEVPQPVNRVIRGFRGFSFRAVKTGRFVILSESCDGLVDGLGCEYMIAGSKIKERWPNAKLPDDIERLIVSDGMREFKCLHVVLPRPLAEQSSIGAKGMPWASIWILYDKRFVLDESGYLTFPAAVPRYHRTPGEVYGRGRGDYAFPDIWTLNTAKRMGLEDWALKIKPPPLVRSGSVLGTLRLIPGAPTSVNTFGRPISEAIMPYQTGSHPEVSQIKEEELRKSIKQIFFVEQVLAMLEVSKSEMTAYEFAKKIELLFRLMGPVYGRTEWEYLYRTSDATFALQNAAGDFPPAPNSLKEEGGGIAIQFQNPLAKAQRSGDSEALLMAINDVTPLVPNYPQMLDWIDPDETMLGVLATRGVAAKWTRNKRQVADLRAARAAQQARQQQLDQATQISEAAKNAAPTLKLLQGGEQGAQGA